MSEVYDIISKGTEYWVTGYGASTLDDTQVWNGAQWIEATTKDATYGTVVDNDMFKGYKFAVDPVNGDLALLGDEISNSLHTVYERSSAGTWSKLTNGGEGFASTLNDPSMYFDIAYFNGDIYLSDGTSNVWRYNGVWDPTNPPVNCYKLKAYGSKLYCVGAAPPPVPEGTRYCLNTGCSGTPNVMIGGGSWCGMVSCTPALCSGGYETCTEDPPNGCLQDTLFKGCSPFAEAEYTEVDFETLGGCLSQCTLTEGGVCFDGGYYGAECTLNNGQYSCFCTTAPVGSFHASVDGVEKGVLHYGYGYETKTLDLGDDGVVTVKHANADVGLIDHIALDGIAPQVIDMTTGEDITLKVAAADGVIADVSGHELLLGEGRVLTMTASEYDVRSIERGMTLLLGGGMFYSWDGNNWAQETAPDAYISDLFVAESPAVGGCAGDGTGTASISPNTGVGLTWKASEYGGETATITAVGAPIATATIAVPVGWTAPGNCANTGACAGKVSVDGSYSASEVSVSSSLITINFVPELAPATFAVITITGLLRTPAAEGSTEWVIKTTGSGAGCVSTPITVQPTVVAVYPPVSTFSVSPDWQSILVESTTAAFTWACTDAYGYTIPRSKSSCVYTPAISSGCAGATYHLASNGYAADSVTTGASTGLCAVSATTSNSKTASSELVVYGEELKQWSGGVDGINPYVQLGLTFTPNTVGTFYLTEFDDDGSFAAAGGEAGCGPWDFYNDGGGTVTIVPPASCPTTCLTKSAGGSWSSVACDAVPAFGAGGGFGGGGAATGGRVYSAPTFTSWDLVLFFALSVLVVVAYLSSQPTRHRK